MALWCLRREEGMLKLARCTCFLADVEMTHLQRRYTLSRVNVSTNINTQRSLLPNCWKLFSWVLHFFCNGWPNMETNAKTALCPFCAKFQSPALLTLERAKGVPINPYWHRSRIGSRVWKVDCAYFRHMSTSGFREKRHYSVLFSYYAPYRPTRRR